jgi:hypothetical protein
MIRGDQRQRHEQWYLLWFDRSQAAIYQDSRSKQIEMGDGQMITLFGISAEFVKEDWFLFS